MRVIAGGRCVCGVVGASVLGLPAWRGVIKRRGSRTGLGWPAVDGESPVGETAVSSLGVSRVARSPCNSV
jgi:hypothetical protein